MPLYASKTFLLQILSLLCVIFLLPASSLSPIQKRSLSLSSQPSTLASSTIPPMDVKIDTAKSLFGSKFSGQTATIIAVAPGRVNLIGEHTDYTGGFVLPFAIDYSTVVIGTGSVEEKPDNQERTASIRFVSDKSPEEVEAFEISESSKPPTETAWTTYVVGTVFQYLPDLKSPQSHLDLTFTIAGDVPLGSGLSSSASLEVSVARFVEVVLGDAAFSSVDNDSIKSPAKWRALRCQKAENEWCHSPCGIMDQAVSSAAKAGSLLLIDCRSLTFNETKMNEQCDDTPVLVIANSNVQHDIAGGEYPVRVAQCKTATEALRQVNPNIESLRDATPDDVETAREYMDETSYKRAKHVTTENERTLQAKEELERGDWNRVGELMNESHASMRDDYEVSCEEVDVLVDIAQQFPGVYGSRLTGGGFGGCTVTLVAKDKARDLMDHMQQEYKARTGKHCPCFETKPSRGAHLLSIKDHKPFV
ncbi:galactokinase [Nitzschia inconspicua]|uniref:Galactokinase n=1 Tax=Nitzschia inconspicua TaxID=303405 RepID=A0A9K3PPJ4_9STRA|nr:galactokinase [Nitzschia inconspicua]